MAVEVPSSEDTPSSKKFEPGARFGMVVLDAVMTMTERVDVIGQYGRNIGTCWWGRCDCGSPRKAFVQWQLKAGAVTSCGCRQRNGATRMRRSKHGRRAAGRLTAPKAGEGDSGHVAKVKNEASVRARIKAMADEYRRTWGIT